MQPGATTCTEDRIQHALERCLHGLSLSRCSTSWSAGLCLNCWSLQELVSRDPGHFLILLEQILQKTREVQEKGTYDLLAPLALLFYSTVLCTPHFPPDSDLLLKAARTYHRFLTWPVPYCSICQELLTFIDAELKAPAAPPKLHSSVLIASGLLAGDQSSLNQKATLFFPSIMKTGFKMQICWQGHILDNPRSK
uniref:Phosphoinositide 3-kinase regulatory subunit 5 n=1 Tax=Canis lupus familiaris TaxID=9615 RepID=A0A8C0SLB7_CANLF